MAAILILVATATTQANAKETLYESLCNAQIKSCEEGLRLADIVVKTQQQEIEIHERQSEEMQKMLSQAYVELERKEAWYRDPFTVFLLGLTAGYVAFGR